MTAMFSKLKQYKDMRDKAKKAQGAFGQITAEGSGAKGKVAVTLDGNFQVQNVTVDPELLTADAKSKLEDGIKDAFGDAIKKVQKEMAALMRKGDVDLPNF